MSAKLHTEITSFRGEYRFLSNFALAEVTALGVTAATSEHLYQAMKTEDPERRTWVLASDSPGESKRRGRKVALRPDWETIKLDIMRAVVNAKFEQHLDLASRLLETGEAVLIEGNTFGDRFFGAELDLHTGNWVGENHLGKILMAIREELRNSGVVPAQKVAAQVAEKNKAG